MASCLRLHSTTMLQAGHSLLPRRWHCSDSGDFRVFRASILEFRPRLGNRRIDSGDFRGFRASILDFRPKLGNRCTDSGDFWVFRAAILEFRPRLANRCTDSGDFRGFRAVILYFRPRLGNRCTDSGHFRVFRAVILDFRPRIGNRCSNGGLQAKLIFVAATKIRVGRGTSQQRRTAGETNLRRRNEDQSRTRNIAATATKGEIFR